MKNGRPFSEEERKKTVFAKVSLIVYYFKCYCSRRECRGSLWVPGTVSGLRSMSQMSLTEGLARVILVGDLSLPVPSSSSSSSSFPSFLFLMLFVRYTLWPAGPVGVGCNYMGANWRPRATGGWLAGRAGKGQISKARPILGR